MRRRTSVASRGSSHFYDVILLDFYDITYLVSRVYRFPRFLSRYEEKRYKRGKGNVCFVKSLSMHIYPSTYLNIYIYKHIHALSYLIFLAKKFARINIYREMSRWRKYESRSFVYIDNETVEQSGYSKRTMRPWEMQMGVHQSRWTAFCESVESRGKLTRYFNSDIRSYTYLRGLGDSDVAVT